jgi:hypothetical protein
VNIIVSVLILVSTCQGHVYLSIYLCITSTTPIAYQFLSRHDAKADKGTGSGKSGKSMSMHAKSGKGEAGSDMSVSSKAQMSYSHGSGDEGSDEA